MCLLLFIYLLLRTVMFQRWIDRTCSMVSAYMNGWDFCPELVWSQLHVRCVYKIAYFRCFFTSTKRTVSTEILWIQHAYLLGSQHMFLSICYRTLGTCYSFHIDYIFHGAIFGSSKGCNVYTFKYRILVC